LSLMLKRGIEALVGTALVVAILLAVFPAVAEAQSTAKGGAAAERSVVVVSPGDSLWSISAERLGGDATPQQIAKGVEQIYALNRDRIGADPNLIFAGQRFSLPLAMDGGAASNPDDAKATSKPPSATREGAGRVAAAATHAKGSQEADAGATALGDKASQASRTTIEVGQGAANKAKAEEKAPVPAADNEPPRLPKIPEGDAAPAVPAVRQAASEEDSPTTSSRLAPLLGSVRSVVNSASSAVGETFAEVRAAAPSEPRRTLGWAIVALTVVVGALIAWMLPMRRTTRREAERWATYYGYYGSDRYTYNSVNLVMPTVEQDEREQRAPHKGLPRSAPEALEASSINDSKAKGSKANLFTVVRFPRAGDAPRTGLAKQRRLVRVAAQRSGQSVLHKGLVTGVNRAEVHHVLHVPPNRQRRLRKPPKGSMRAPRQRLGERGR
jgi:hypothetical protein